MRKVLVAAALAACSASALGAEERAPPTQVFFLADPQIHNVYGAALKQMFPVSNWVSGVAIRPPEVNLLAPLTLRYALQQGQARLPANNPLVVVLGDGTNIACSGEADTFDAEFKRAPREIIRLMAHGNHDSYLMGTVNSYIPTDAAVRKPVSMETASLPVDESFWQPSDAPKVQGTSMRDRNWLDGCYRPSVAGSDPGTPMNKVRWLARYAEDLKLHGLEQTSNGNTSDGGLAFSGVGQPGTTLGRMNYRFDGVWYRPQPGGRDEAMDYMRTWKSFIVQAVDLDERHTLILIDTSVCEKAEGGPAYISTNAGQIGCIGESQFITIHSLIQGISRSRSLIVAGHFPLHSLKKEGSKLSALLEAARPEGWTYVSGHTHNAMTDTTFGNGRDRNIGSTTDWPMESHILTFHPDTAQIIGTQSIVLGAPPRVMKYKKGLQWPGTYSELCRHLEVAKALAKADPHQSDARWTSPSTSRRKCRKVQDDWAESARELIRLQELVSKRFDEEPGYRDFMLSVAAGASLHEHNSFSLGNYIH
ncbi:hypothetical protein [Stenotrophomonas sp. GZD-301]|uniref:hypothetical protein n=1 Tax=Stenotrophomonas sp. GZD-301 TaxID=3404814 RepID=UPI003BB7B02E